MPTGWVLFAGGDSFMYNKRAGLGMEVASWKLL